jgi:hypothetical protein
VSDVEELPFVDLAATAVVELPEGAVPQVLQDSAVVNVVEEEEEEEEE